MTWTLDTAHSKIGFVVRHMMISKVRGEFKQYTADVKIDPNHLETATINVEVDINSVDTNQNDRDNHLRSADFFNVEEFPKMTFTSTSFKSLGGGKVELTGDLTIRGTTKPVTLKGEQEGPVKNPFSGQTTVGYTLEGSINREDFGLTWNQAMETGGVLVGKEIKINIEAEVMQA